MTQLIMMVRRGLYNKGKAEGQQPAYGCTWPGMAATARPLAAACTAAASGSRRDLAC